MRYHRRRYRQELRAQYGLADLPSGAELSLLAAARHAAEGDHARAATALGQAGRACEAAQRAARGRPRAVPGPRPATARDFPRSKSENAGAGFNPENPSGVAARLRAQVAGREPPAGEPPTPDPLATRIAELEAELARGAAR